MQVHDILKQASLPHRLTNHIRRIAHRTRLRSRERAMVAEMLCTEAANRLAAGEIEKTIISSLRPRARVARRFRHDLLKYSMLRKTGWTVATWIKRSIATSILITLVIYPYLFWRFHAPTPKLTRNLTAEYNATIDAIPPEDRAVDLYTQAADSFEVINDRSARTFGIAWPLIFPEDSFWAEACAYIDRNEHAIAMIRKGTARPHAGYRLTVFLPTDPRSNNPVEIANAWNGNPPSAALCLEPFGQYRTFARILAADARLAAQRSQPNRALDDLLSMIWLAAHSEEGRSVIGDLVGIAIRTLAFELIGELVIKYPELFNDTHLHQLSEAVSIAINPNAPKIDLEIEQLNQIDFAQRVFTDDGSGDGRICFDGIRFIRALGNDPEWDMGTFVLGPLNATRFATRRQYLDEVEVMCSAIQQDSKGTLWQWKDTPGAAFVRQRKAMSGRALLLEVPVILAPSLGKTAFVYEHGLQMRDAALVMLALAEHHLDHARYPDSLQALVPEYLTDIPPDRYDGQPIKYLVTEDGSPLLYSVGSDRADDGGIPQEGDTNGTNAMKWCPPAEAHLVAPGDWIILPRPRPEPLSDSD